MGACCGGSAEGKRAVRVLVLGLAGCGKSTLLKQFNFLNTGAYVGADVDCVGVANANMLAGMKNLLKLAQEQQLQVEEGNLKHERYIKEQPEVENIPTLHEKMKALWKDETIQKIWSQNTTIPIQIKIMDYLMENIDRYNPEITEQFVPTDEDLLLLRQRTTGTVTIRFSSPTEKFDWEFIDVGGQRPERQKWMEVLDNGVDAILYMVALDECCIACLEDENYKSNLLYSKKVLEEFVQQTPKAKNIPKIVFLNKKDLFLKAFEHPDFSDRFQAHYPDYSAPSPPSSDHTVAFLSDLFKITKETKLWTGTSLNREFISTLYKNITTTILTTKLHQGGFIDLE